MTSYDRFTFGIPRLYLGLDLAVTLIGLFALVEIIGKAELSHKHLNTRAGTIGKDDGKITKEEYKRMLRPVIRFLHHWLLCGHRPRHRCFRGLLVLLQHRKEYVQAPGGVRSRLRGGHRRGGKRQQRGLRCHPDPPADPGHPRRRLCRHYAVCPDASNGLNPGLSLFTTDGPIMYAIMLGLILVNIFMFLQGRYLTGLFRQGGIHPSADPDPHHCDLLLRRCLLRQQQLL